jgi:hypothetical protein
MIVRSPTDSVRCDTRVAVIGLKLQRRLRKIKMGKVYFQQQFAIGARLQQYQGLIYRRRAALKKATFVCQ